MATILPPMSSQNNHHSTFTHLLSQCKTMRQFKQIHSQVIRTGLSTSPAIQSQMLSFVTAQNWADMGYAQYLFDEMPEPDLSHWNALIHGYSRLDSAALAVPVYVRMIARGCKPDRDTFGSLLSGFTRDTAISFGDEIHSQLVKFGFGSDEMLRRLLVGMYVLTGEIDDARQLFDRGAKGDVTIWNNLISGYSKNNRFEESCELFKDMVRENLSANSVTCISVLSACAKLKDLELGVRVHLHAEEQGLLPDLKLENALINMYTECGAIGAACRLFDGMIERDLGSWSSLIVGLAKSGQMDHARLLFDQMPEKDVLCCTAMIDAYVKRSHFKEALEIFQAARDGDHKLGELTLVAVLSACAELGALETGEWVRCFLDRNNINLNVSTGNTLINMYAKCGVMVNAMWIFDKMDRKDKHTWNTAIAGFAINGHGKEAISLFHEMVKSGESPDEATFCSVFTACANAGLIDEARELFISMIVDFGWMPNVTHYRCKIDLLCRTGRLKEALETISNMPMRPNSDIWGTLLGACKAFGSMEMGEYVAKNLIELNPDDITAYVLLCNLYAKFNKSEDQRRIKEMILAKGIEKEPGCSYIEVKRTVHEFESGGGSHPLIEKIHSKLKEMNGILKLYGCSSDELNVFAEVVPGEEKVFWHSEKVALAFGLLRTGPLSTVRIVKLNFMICSDCHKAMKLLSKIYNREIVLRDRVMVHHFKNGSCSCTDFHRGTLY